MLGSAKNSFWQALILTVFVFAIGLIVGIVYEGTKVNEMNNYYSLSEVSLADSLNLNNLIDLNKTSCSSLSNSEILFADRIYSEATLLEKYEDSGKITDSLRVIHTKYDLLRTMLWINAMKISEKCGKQFSTVVYLYDYQTNDLNQKAVQEVWSRILFDLKQKMGSRVLLIPIAVDSNLSSLDSLLNDYQIQKFPIVIIDNNKTLYTLTSEKDLEKEL